MGWREYIHVRVGTRTTGLERLVMLAIAAHADANGEAELTDREIAETANLIDIYELTREHHKLRQLVQRCRARQRSKMRRRRRNESADEGTR